MFKVSIDKINGNDKPKNQIAFVSSFFMQNEGDKFNIHNRTLIFVKGLIKSIIGFPELIRQYTENPADWYYYLYIDKYLLMPLKKDKIKRNDEHEIKILEIIWELVDMLVKRIQNDKKYENVIIYSYHNKTTDNGIGHLNYYGTMMRYMSFYNENIKYAIIRNCRTPIAPIDVLMQKEWINSGKDYLFTMNKD